MILPADYIYLPENHLGIAYISASLKKAGFNVFTLNLSMDKHPLREILSQLISYHDISVVGCWGKAKSCQNVKDVIDTTKKIDPSIITFIGGQLVTNSTIEAMTIIPSADYGVIGDDETTACELMWALRANTSTTNIESIVYRTEDGGLVITDKRHESHELDKIPFPDHEGFFDELISNTSNAFITTTRSCPSKCTFCCCNSEAFRLRSMDNVFVEIDYLVNKYNISRLTIADEVFTVRPERIVEFCGRIKKYNLKWVVHLRLSDFLTSEMLQMMKDTGCERIFYGLESADDRILKSMKKGTTVSLMENVLSRTKSAGIKTMGSFVFGDVEESEESVIKTLKWIGSHSDILDAFTAGMVQCYPGSTICDDAVKNDIINPIDHILKGCPPVNISKLPYELYSILANEIIPIERARRMFKWPVWMGVDAVFTSNDFGYTATCICPDCQTEHHIDITAYDLYSRYSDAFICKVCNYQWVFFPILHYVHFIEDRLVNTIKKYKCAIWPVSQHFATVYESSDAFKHLKNEYVLINKNEKISGKILLGKCVYTPDILSTDKEIETVIVFSRFYKEIEKEVQSYYPHIKTVLFHDIGLMKI